MYRILLLGLLACALIACASQADPTVTPEPIQAASTLIPTVVPPTLAPTDVPPTPTPVPDPTDVPIVPLIEIADQVVGDDGIVRIGRVVSAETGWMTLISSGIDLITFPIVAGTTENLEVTVDPLLLGETLTAHLFGGGGNTFDAAVNLPVTVNDAPVEAAIAIDLQVTTPQVDMLKQEVFEDGIVIVESIVATEAGWLAIHNDDNGALGKMIGFYVVRGAGVYERIPVHVLWREATPTLHAVLYGDGEIIGRFEPELDPIIRVQDSPVQSTFNATYPPDVYIVDQPVISNTIIVERVISNGPGWITVMFETDEETPGNIIGFAPLADGVNENVLVELVPGGATPMLYARVHTDTGVAGEFDFPANDLPVLYQDQVYTFEFETEEGNYVLSADQPIYYESGVASVVVPMAVSDLDMWVVVRAELADGVLGDVIGYTWRPPGVHRDIVVEIDAEAATETLYAGMHIDRDAMQQFEFPDGRDYELQRQRTPITSPFVVLP